MKTNLYWKAQFAPTGGAPELKNRLGTELANSRPWQSCPASVTILKEFIKTSKDFAWIRDIISIYSQSIHSELLKNRCYIRSEYSYQVRHRFFFWFSTHKEFINNFSWRHIMVTIPYIQKSSFCPKKKYSLLIRYELLLHS